MMSTAYGRGRSATAALVPAFLLAVLPDMSNAWLSEDPHQASNRPRGTAQMPSPRVAMSTPL